MLCYYAECRILFTIMLNVVMPNDVMLSIVMLSVVMLSFGMLSVVVRARQPNLKLKNRPKQLLGCRFGARQLTHHVYDIFTQLR
jgi:hypothetical protein